MTGPPDPLLENLPAGVIWGLDVPTVQYLPDGHAVQEPAPADAEYFPIAHEIGDAEPTGEYLPAGAVCGLVEPAGQYLPAGQVMYVPEPVLL